MTSKLNIPINFFGEPPGIIGLGRWERLIGKGSEELTRSEIDQYQGFNGYRISDMMQYDTSLKHKDVIPYIYPSKEELKNDTKSLHLGHYFPWEFKKNIEIIKNFGWKTSDKTEGTYTDFEDIDCGFMPIHQYFKFVKYGYGRATDHASYEIRQGRMNKKQAKELIIEYEGKVPTKYFKEFLKFLNITEDHFFKTRDRFTNPILFKKDEADNVAYGNDKNLLLNKLWHDSFNV